MIHKLSIQPLKPSKNPIKAVFLATLSRSAKELKILVNRLAEKYDF